MQRRAALIPAPSRGHYDRALPRERRLAEQRERLLAAAAAVLARELAPSVASVVRYAGTGRNTFYEYFDDLAHVRRASEAATLRKLEARLREADERSRTPVERWRALARTWLSFAESEPAEHLLVLRVEASGRSALSTGGALLATALFRSLETLRAAGVASPVGGRERVFAVAAAGEALARELAASRLADSELQADRADREARERVFVDIASRLLR